MRKVINYENYSATINTVGATCLSFSRKFLGETAHIVREPNELSDEKSFLFGIPLLFPPNRIDGGNFSYNGITYTFPINDKKCGCSLHSNINTENFLVVFESVNFVSLRLDKDFYGNVFQPHSIIIDYLLDRQGLKQTVTVKNRSEFAMPYALGFHSSFAIPFLSGSNASDITVMANVEKEIERNERYLPTGRTVLVENSFLTFSADECVSKVCKATKHGKVKILDEKRRVFVEYVPDEKFLYRVFFNGGNKNFICAEAQTCNVNGLRTQSNDDGFLLLAPFAQETFVSYIKISDIKN